MKGGSHVRYHRNSLGRLHSNGGTYSVLRREVPRVYPQRHMIPVPASATIQPTLDILERAQAGRDGRNYERERKRSNQTSRARAAPK